MKWKTLLLLVAVIGIGGAAYLNSTTKPYVLGAVKAIKNFSQPSQSPASDSGNGGMPSFASRNATWNQLIPLTSEQEQAIGLRMATVEEQTEPMVLELNATTAYDQESLTQIRPRFDSLVTHVFKTLGDPVKKGDNLVELYSSDLAKAKNDLQVAYVQWLHDQRWLNTRKKLRESEGPGVISEREWTETVNAEAKSKLDYNLAYDQLKVYGLEDEEINPLIAGLTAESLPSLKLQKVSEKASMIMRSPAEGIVIKRDVVPGNLYEPQSVLLVIAPIDHLRVYANVYERDIDAVQVKQEMIVHFPYLARNVACHVEVISNQVDPDTHAMRIRGTIKNPGGVLKADMLARAELHIKAAPGYTTVSRNAMITTNGRYYVFVKKAPNGAAQVADTKSAPDASVPADEFERREIRVRQERSNFIIVAEGLKKGEQVATNGSLILAQMYEDMSTVDTGTPLQ